MEIFDPVQIKVKDLENSKRFYDAIMTALGYPTVLNIKDRVIGYGTSIYDIFETRHFNQEYLFS